MARIRHCIECPECRTRYLPGFNPYPNGSYLVPLARSSGDTWTLHCACRTPSTSSRWSCEELKLYAVSSEAYVRGYGSPKEIVEAKRRMPDSRNARRGVHESTPTSK
jgi:hypothetical protein